MLSFLPGNRHTKVTLPPNEWHAWLLKADRKTYRPTLIDLLTRYIGTAPAFAETHRHKPYLTNSPLQFNVSHSGDFVLIGITNAAAIGVDIERIKHFDSMDDIALSHFTAAEREKFDFFTTWTRKEAYVKAVGEGLYLPLESIDVTGHPAGYTLYDLDAPPGYAAAVAAAGEGHTYRLWEASI